MNPTELENLKQVIMGLRCRAHHFKVSINPHYDLRYTCCCRDLEEEVQFLIQLAHSSGKVEETSLLSALAVRRKSQLQEAAKLAKEVIL